MEEYIDKILVGLPEDMNGVATTPAADHLFKTRNDVPKLNKEIAKLFHCVTVQIIFLAWQTRPTDGYIIPDQASRRRQNR